MFAIALSELRQLFRNRLVLVTALILPVGLSAYFIAQRGSFATLGGLGYVATFVVFTVSAIGLYTTAVTTLAARRQSLFLKRLRSTAASDADIISGLLLPITVIALVQAAVILIALGMIGGMPANPLFVAVAVLATVAMMLSFGLATAGLTNSPEHAQVTTLPISMGTIAVAVWVGITGTSGPVLLKRLLPGGSAAELVRDAWNGGTTVPHALILILPTLAWAVVAVSLATRLFRWEPRR